MNKHYLVLHYTHIPQVDFICEYDGLLRIKVTRHDQINLLDLLRTGTYAIAEGCLYVFEFIGKHQVRKEEFLRALNWYRNYLHLSNMRFLEW